MSDGNFKALHTYNNIFHKLYQLDFQMHNNFKYEKS